MSGCHPGPVLASSWQSPGESRQLAGRPSRPCCHSCSAHTWVPGQILGPTAFCLVCWQRPMGRLPLQNRVLEEMDRGGQVCGASEAPGLTAPCLVVKIDPMSAPEILMGLALTFSSRIHVCGVRKRSTRLPVDSPLSQHKHLFCGHPQVSFSRASLKPGHV